MATIAGISVDIGGDNSNLKKALNDSNNSLKSFSDNVNKSGGNMNNTFGKLGQSIAGAFSVGAIVAFGKHIFDITSDFQKLGAILANTLGSNSEGQIAFAQIQAFAAKTNFSVIELTESFTALANRGLRPTQNNLQGLADVANTLGKPLDDVVQAVLDVTNTERWNELGIKVKKAGDTITASFRGQEVSAKATEQGALDLITAIGKFEGVAGSTAAVSQTLSGATSNLGDAMNTLFATIGGKGSQVISEFIQGLTTTAEAITRLITSSEELKQQGFLKSLGEEGQKVKERIDALTASNEKLGIANAKNAAINQLLADSQANLAQLQKEQLANAEAVKNTIRSEADALLAQAGEIENNITLENKRIEVLDQIAKGTFGTTTATVGLTKAIVDQKNSLEIVNEQLEKYYGILGNPDADNTAVAGAAKRIRALEVERDRLQEVIDLRVKQLVPQDLQNLQTTSRGEQPLQGITDTSGIKAVSTAAIDAQKNLETLTTGFNDFQQTFQEAGGVIVDNSASISNAIIGIADTFGEFFAGLANGSASVGKLFGGLLIVVADFLASFGKALITAAVASVAFQQLIENPYAALAAGLAVIVASAIVRSIGSSFGAKKMAAGGIAYGPTYAMVGEYPNARNNPEVVAPLSKLKAMLGEGNGWGGQVEFVLQGETLKGVLRNYDRGSDRRG